MPSLDLLSTAIARALAQVFPGAATPTAPQPPSAAAQQSFRPASHLNTYPTPQGGPSARPPFGAALNGEVSAQHIHHTVRVSGHNSPTTVRISSPGSSATDDSAQASPSPFPPTSAIGDRHFTTLQPSLQPVDLLSSDKAPSSADAMEDALNAWLDSLSVTLEDRGELAAVALYVRRSIQLLKLVDCRYVLQYHRTCASAGATGLYHPKRDGEIYPLGLLHVHRPQPLFLSSLRPAPARRSSTGRQGQEEEGGRRRPLFPLRPPGARWPHRSRVLHPPPGAARVTEERRQRRRLSVGEEVKEGRRQVTQPSALSWDDRNLIHLNGALSTRPGPLGASPRTTGTTSVGPVTAGALLVPTTTGPAADPRYHLR